MGGDGTAALSEHGVSLVTSAQIEPSESGRGAAGLCRDRLLSSAAI